MQAYLEQIDRVIEQGMYKDNWESLQQYRVPEWYRAAKFGIFIEHLDYFRFSIIGHAYLTPYLFKIKKDIY